MLTSDFQYELPPDAIAQSAIEPRHDARLLDTRSMSDHRFLDLADLLMPGDVVVVNRTRVRRARLRATRPTGGSVEVLLLRPIAPGTWEALARPTRRLHAGSVLLISGVEATLTEEPEDGRVIIAVDGDLEAVAADEGEMPLPPYFTGSLEDPLRYQTLFADSLGSAAAPTAGLHFTTDVVESLARRGVAIERIDLQVGIDTFRPISVEKVGDHEMHSEYVVVDAATIDRLTEARADGGRVVAIGTTVVRALESAAETGDLQPIDGPTSLFIRPGHPFRAVDLVATNFHVPGSSLVVMMAAILGPGWRDVYEEALRRDYRFLSFGDAMLAEVPR